MATIPGIRFDITGASGSQGLLTPKSSWRCYVLPRGGYASASSTGTLLTFDSAAIAGRFAALDWIQAGLSAANIRQVAAVGGNSLSVSGAALTVSENDRIYIIGSTEPTISGGSVTYSTPATTVRQRDDDGSDLYTNSMITTNADGLVQFFSVPAVYDCLIQDGNQALQGSLIDVPVGLAEGISTSQASVFGATVTINAALGVTGWVTFGQTVTFNAAVGVTGWATFGATVTMNAALGVTGVATLSGRAAFGNSVSIDGALGVTGWATFGSTITGAANFGVTGTGVFGATLTTAGITNVGHITTTRDVSLRRLFARQGTTLTAAGFSLSSTWGSTASVAVNQTSYDTHGQIQVTAGGAGIGANPSVTLNFVDGTFTNSPIAMMSRASTSQDTVPWRVTCNATQAFFTFMGTPVVAEVFTINYLVVG